MLACPSRGAGRAGLRAVLQGGGAPARARQACRGPGPSLVAGKRAARRRQRGAPGVGRTATVSNHSVPGWPRRSKASWRPLPRGRRRGGDHLVEERCRDHRTAQRFPTSLKRPPPRLRVHLHNREPLALHELERVGVEALHLRVDELAGSSPAWEAATVQEAPDYRRRDQAGWGPRDGRKSGHRHCGGPVRPMALHRALSPGPADPWGVASRRGGRARTRQPPRACRPPSSQQR